MENIILGVLLEMPDPQRDNFVLNSNDYSLIKPFVESANKFGYKVVILYNNLTPNFVSQYSSSNLSFVRVTPYDNYNVYTNKFLLVNEYLSIANPNKVLISDITDVVFLKEGLFDFFNDEIIYSGVEPVNMGIQWLENNSRAIRGQNPEFDKWWDENKSKLPLLNCGLIGGNYKFIKQELRRVVDILSSYTKNINEMSDMFAWNITAYLSQKKIFTGEPFHTEFRKLDYLNKNCYVSHK